jgi:hypothetical protein
MFDGRALQHKVTPFADAADAAVPWIRSSLVFFTSHNSITAYKNTVSDAAKRIKTLVNGETVIE